MSSSKEMMQDYYEDNCIDLIEEFTKKKGIVFTREWYSFIEKKFNDWYGGYIDHIKDGYNDR